MDQVSLLDNSTKDSCIPSDMGSFLNDDLRMGFGKNKD